MDKLFDAFAEKEKAEIYLFNLDKLKQENSIEENFYNSLKNEYLNIRDQAAAKVDSIKAEIQDKLDSRLHDLAVTRLNYKYLEIRHKVGELSDSSFSNKAKEPQKKIEYLEKTVKELKDLVNSTSASDIKPIPVKKFSLGVDMFKKESPQVQVRPDNINKRSDNDAILTGTDGVTVIESVPVSESTALMLPPDVAAEKPEVKKILPSELRITSLQILPNRVTSGNHVGIIALVKNMGQQDIDYKLELKINDEIKDYKDISLSPGISEEVTFVILTNLPGEYQVELDGQSGKYQVLPY